MGIARYTWSGVWWLLGIAAVCFAVAGVFVQQSRPPGGMTVTGGVIAVVDDNLSMSKSRRGCEAAADFTVNGVTYRTGFTNRTSPCPWRVQQPVDVAYAPTNPADSQVLVPAGTAMRNAGIAGVIGSLLVFFAGWNALIILRR